MDLSVLCVEFDKLTRRFEDTYNLPEEVIGDAALDAEGRLISTQHRLVLDRLCATLATTLAGIRAKADCVIVFAPENLADALAGTTFDRRLMASIWHDLGWRAPE